MTGKKQQIEQEELRAARHIMIRALSILAAVAALAVSAAPASAGLLSSPLGATGAMGTRSGGEVVSNFAKAPAAMRRTAIKDGTSNTLLGVVDVIERDNGRRVNH